jgi:hypothetical protein
MAEPLAGQISRLLDEAEGLYYKLVLLVGAPGSGKTAALKELGALSGVPVTNVNLELSRRLLDLTERQRSVQTPGLLRDILAAAGHGPTILDNLELLFDPGLRLDALRLLLGLARNRAIVAAWSGTVEDGRLIYAEPGHPEHCSFAVQDFLVVEARPATGATGQVAPAEVVR